MLPEGNPGQHIDTAQEIEARLKQHEEQEVANYLEKVGLKSARFQALADRIDWKTAEEDVLRSNPENTTTQLQMIVRLGNIEETMRKRNNGEIEGYDREYKPADDFLNGLWTNRFNIMTERLKTHNKMTLGQYDAEYNKEYGRFIYNLTEVKKLEVGKRSQPTPQQQ